MKLQALKAKHGDCLVMEAGGARLLIDGGPPGVYRRFLKPFLEKLEASANQFDLMMISHIDSDHIAGILDLTAELIDAADENTEPLVGVSNVWHNSFADVIANGNQPAALEARNQSLRAANLVDEDISLKSQMDDAAFVLASVGQGRRLRNDIGRLKLPLNTGFSDGLIIAKNPPVAKSFGNLRLTIAGPGKAQVDDLRAKWKTELPKLLAKQSDEAAAIAAAGRLDTSIANLSSLVAIAESDNRSALFTGDARGDSILDFLEQGQLRKVFDIIKLPHHGSSRNVTKEFFETVRAKHYVVSGDGKHGNPDPETLDLLFRARPELDYKIYMTYGPSELTARSEFDASGFETVMGSDSRRRDTLVFPKNKEPLISISL